MSATLPGNSGLVYGMIVAIVCILPFSIGNITPVFSNFGLFSNVLMLAVLSTAIPFFFEFSALRKLSAHTYGVLITLEPAVAALIGALLLGDALGVKGIVAVACVTIAAVGATMTSRRDARGSYHG